MTCLNWPDGYQIPQQDEEVPVGEKSRGPVLKDARSNGSSSLIEKLLGKALNDDILAKLRSLFAKKCGPVRGTALLPGSVCFCLQDVRKGKDQGAPETQSMQPVVLLPTESGYHGSHRYCVVGGLPPLPKKVYRVRWSSLTPLDSGDEDIIFRHYRILWRRPGTKEDELVELAAPSERGLCQILAVDGVHEVNPEELSWNRAMPKRFEMEA
ncbi:unnamed protein product [Durusdinium trenchii]|uniref:Uncharacterized protein n=2 Tax=Durusdinium trenchii TaxID=1381693 RepID=A0ABP0NWJ5_9DINO